jgi:hypothetical protein
MLIRFGPSLWVAADCAVRPKSSEVPEGFRNLRSSHEGHVSLSTSFFTLFSSLERRPVHALIAHLSRNVHGWRNRTGHVPRPDHLIVNHSPAVSADTAGSLKRETLRMPTSFSQSKMKKCYRSKDGREYFNFTFVPRGNQIEIYCTRHPSLNGHDTDPRKTHIFASGKLCFVGGHEPHTQDRAEHLAAQWAEYILEYRRTGAAQG